MKKNEKLIVCASIAYMEDRVRLNKLKEVFENNRITYSFWGWRRTKEIKSKSYSVKHLWIGGGFSSKKLFVHYPIWILMVFIHSLKLSSKNTIYAVSLDVALPIYIGSLFKGYNYIFDNPDNFSLTYNLSGFSKWFIDKVESKVAQKSVYHIVPDKSRFKENHNNLVILPNFPLASEIKKAKEIYNYGLLDEFQLETITKDKRFKIYINGRMVKYRGSEWISEIFLMLDPQKFLIIVAGNIYCDKLDKTLLSLSNVVRFERLENYKALSLYYCADLVFAFYDPILPINRKAAANKWWDCVVCKTPFVSNIEVETLGAFKQHNACFLIEYDNNHMLLELLNKLEQDRARLIQVKKNLESLNVYSWEKKINELMGLLYLKDK